MKNCKQVVSSIPLFIHIELTFDFLGTTVRTILHVFFMLAKSWVTENPEQFLLKQLPPSTDRVKDFPPIFRHLFLFFQASKCTIIIVQQVLLRLLDPDLPTLLLMPCLPVEVTQESAELLVSSLLLFCRVSVVSKCLSQTILRLLK